MDITGLALPALPVNHAWAIDAFRNDEVQAYKPGTKLVMTVKRRWSVLGIPVRVRPSGYPVYIMPANGDAQFLRETADLILQAHVSWLGRHPGRVAKELR